MPRGECSWLVRPMRHARAQRRQRVLRPVRQERGQTLKKKGEEYKKPPALRPAASTKALYRLCRTGPWRVPVSRSAPAARTWARSGEHRGLPVLPPRFTVIEIASGVNHGTWDSVAEDVVVCLAYAKLVPGPDVEADSRTYVEHRPVSGAGVLKARSRIATRASAGICAFAPCAAHSRQEPSKASYSGNAIAT